MNPIVVIPARMASTRLPGKPLADINGKPMILHMLERGREAGIGPVAVACGDLEIADVVRAARDVQAAALSVCSDTTEPQIRALMCQARDEIEIVASTVSRLRSIAPR